VIRWKYVLPRVILLTLALLAVTFGSGPLLHVALITGGEAAIGAKVEIERLDARWWDTSLTLDDVRIADPRRPMTNLIEADSMVFDMDATHLLRKRFVIDRASLDGVRFGSPRTTSGALPQTPPSAEPTWTDSIIESATDATENRFEAWLDEVRETGLSRLQTDLETVRLATEMSERWPQDYRRLEERVRAIEERVKKVKGVVERPNSNPLRLVQLLTEAETDVRSTLADIEFLESEFKRLARQVPVDRRALVEAQARDRAKLKELVRLPKIDGPTLTRTVFGEEQGTQVIEALDWIKWIRDVVPNPDKDFTAVRSEGIDVQFAGVPRQPIFWLRHAEISGELASRPGRPERRFRGTLADLTSSPTLLARPLVLDLNLEGDSPAHLIATIDRTTDVRRDHLILELPEVSLGERRIGREDSFALAVPAGSASVRLDVSLDGDRLSGRLDVHRPGSPVEVLHVADRLGGTYVYAALGTALEEVDDFRATVMISGTVRNPKLELESPIGQQLADALNHSVAAVVDDQLDKAEAKLDAEVAEQLAKLEKRIGDVQGLETILAAHRGQLTKLRESVARVTGIGRLR